MASETRKEDCRKYAVRYYNTITNIGGRICRSIMVYELKTKHKTTLSEYLTINKTKITGNRKINKEQLGKLYPAGKAASNPETFDITLMMVLFINFIFAVKDRPNLKIMKKLAEISENDVVDDLARIRCYRNKLHDISDTEVSMGESDFWEDVQKLVEIFIRLERYYTRNCSVVRSIDVELHADLNLERYEGRIQDEMKEWKKFEAEIKKEIEKLKLQTDNKQHRLKDVKPDLPEEDFVKTKQYAKALETLRNRKVIVLYGAPGEGKTTVAKMLLKDVSQKRCVTISSAKDMKGMNSEEVDAVLIDDMFGAGTFDKQIFRQWQNNLNLITNWVQIEGMDRYVVITSRTYILNRAKQNLFVKSLFCEENIIELSSNELEPSEKRAILEKHFSKEKESKNFYTDKDKHNSLLQQVIDRKSNVPSAVFTVGLPECARLFSCNRELYDKGLNFFETPMEEIKNHISMLCEKDETFVAFFVLWTLKEGESIRSRDLEQPIDETSCKILNPIKMIQYSPDSFLRKIRDELKFHAHRSGLIKQDDNESFTFSHHVVRYTVGLIAFERNQSAALALCDETFIQNYIVIPCTSKETIGNSVILKKSRFGQLISRILSLVIPESKISVKEGKVDMLSKHTSLFRSRLFENEEFCTDFFRNDSKSIHILLKTPLRRCSALFKEYKYQFIEKIDTNVRLLSFLLWQNEKVTYFAKECLEEMSRKYMEQEIQQELTVALYIASAHGLHDIAEFCIEKGGEINSKMFLIAYANARKTEKSSETNESEKVLLLLRTAAEQKKCFPDKDKCCPIHLAALENDLDFVRDNIKEKDANIPLEYFSRGVLPHEKELYARDLKSASLYHIAVFDGNRQLVELLHDNKVPAKQVDIEGRTPFLYAIEIGKIRVVNTLFSVAKENGNEMRANKKGETPLHLAIIKSVMQKTEQYIFKKVALELCKTKKGDLHSKDNNDKSPLHIACINYQPEVIEALLKSEENFHLKEQNLVHELIKDGNVSAIRGLKQFGFDCNMTNDDGVTPMELAQKLREEEIIDLFREGLSNPEETPLSL